MRSKRVKIEKAYGEGFYFYVVENLFDKIENKSLYCYNMEGDFVIFSEVNMYFLNVLF